jgi:hypothetical protein
MKQWSIEKSNKGNKITERLVLNSHPVRDQNLIDYYLQMLIKKLTEDCNDDASSLSSLKRFKTERFFKYTIKSTMKSIDIG